MPSAKSQPASPAPDFCRLVQIMAKLRDPNGGCPWDLEQDFASIKPYTIEEAYEVADAIERQDYEDLCAELGDLLLQPVYHAQMAAEQGLFTIDDVVNGIADKLVRRHPHVFGDEDVKNSGAVENLWDSIKAQERAQRGEKRGDDQPPSILADVPRALPALARAEKLQKRAAKVGFDWPEASQVLDKCKEELAEVEQAMAQNKPEAIKEEIGDLLFVVANLARKHGILAEDALSDANIKFTRRFSYVEQKCVEDDVKIEKAGLDILDGYWNEIRARDKQKP